MGDPAWRERFLKAMREYPVVLHAAEFAGVSRKTAYEHRNTDPAFADDWEDAKQAGLDKVELLAYEKAREGDTGLIKWLLASHRPETYGDRTRAEIVGAGGAPLEVVLSWNRKPKVTDGSEPSDAPDDPGTSAGAA